MPEQNNIELKCLLNAISHVFIVKGALNTAVNSPSSIDSTENNTLSFCSNKNKNRAVALINQSKSSIIICPQDIDFNEIVLDKKTLIQVANPRLVFSQLVRRFFVSPVKYKIHPSAIIDVSTKIGPNVYIGPGCHITGAEIGEYTIIRSNVTIYPKTKIGKNVFIQDSSVIGIEGYGFERNETGEMEEFPQIGGVVIEDDVRIGANVCIARGTLDNTVIGRGTKIDNLVQISHNDSVGRDCQINALVAIAGSVKIGNNTHVATHAVIQEGMKIGQHVIVGMGAIVMSDVPNNKVVVGIPAKTIRDNYQI